MVNHQMEISDPDGILDCSIKPTPNGNSTTIHCRSQEPLELYTERLGEYTFSVPKSKKIDEAEIQLGVVDFDEFRLYTDVTSDDWDENYRSDSQALYTEGFEDELRETLDEFLAFLGF